MTAARQFRIQTVLSIVMTSASALACFLLIPSFGIMGAAVTLVVSSLVNLVGGVLVIYYAVVKLNTAIGESGQSGA